MPSQRTEFSRRTVRWLLPAAVLALTPKCLVCVLAYAGLGAALGLRGVEICGGAPSTLAGPVARALAWPGVAAVVGAIALARTAHRGRRWNCWIKREREREGERRHQREDCIRGSVVRR